MMEIPIPGKKTLFLEHLILDYNGTLAVDGEPVPGVVERLESISRHLKIHVITAGTFGKVEKRLGASGFIKVSVLPPGDQTQAKRTYIETLGVENCAAVGNGRNDRLMIEAAALGIVVMLAEGCAVETLKVADIMCTDICNSLDLFLNPLRLAATLRV